MSFHRACCCGQGGPPPGDVFDSCSDLYAAGDLPDTITASVEFDVSFGRPIPSTFNREEIFYTGSYSFSMEHTSCDPSFCFWSNDVGWSVYSGSITVRRIVYDGDDVVLSDDTATASVPDDMGLIAPIGTSICVTGTAPTTPTAWDLLGDADLSDGLAGSGGNTVFAALIGYDAERNMPPKFFPASISELEPSEILIPTGPFTSITGQDLLDDETSDPTNNPVFSLFASVSFS